MELLTGEKNKDRFMQLITCFANTNSSGSFYLKIIPKMRYQSKV